MVYPSKKHIVEYECYFYSEENLIKAILSDFFLKTFEPSQTSRWGM